jgi:uncharacterized membrane protein YphA (DoxX/SURF4 family)
MTSLLGPFLISCLILTLAFVWVSLTLNKSNEARQAGWGLGTRYFLVLLRLAIGWHFLVEGWDKLNSPAWSSAVYLQESTGPFAPYFRDLAGDRTTTLLTVGPDKQIPADLKSAWQAYFDEFKSYYQLDAEKTKRAETILEQNEPKLRTWLTSESKLVAKPQPQGPPLMVDMTMPERLEDLGKHEEAVREIETAYRGTFGKGTFTKLKDAKAEVKRIRAELKSDLAKQTAEMQTALRDVLTAEQKAMEPPPASASRPIASWNRLDWSDAIVKYGLTAVGACLLAGLLTRTACLGGAVFLFMFFLAMPPLPGWPESPRAEGHYLYLNKNIIEMLALLALATTRSGRWAGLDGLLQFLNPRHRREVPPTFTPSPLAEENAATGDWLTGIPASASVPQENAHGS